MKIEIYNQETNTLEDTLHALPQVVEFLQREHPEPNLKHDLKARAVEELFYDLRDGITEALNPGGQYLAKLVE